jgi:putative acetyltransferase
VKSVTYQDFVIRGWQPGDRQAVADLVRIVLAEYGMTFEPDQTDRDAIQVEEAYWQTGGEFWVVEKAGAIVGSGGFHPIKRGKNGVELRKMFLLPDVRGVGLGRFLLQHLEQSALQKGFQQMWLETATVLKEAVQLYERNGYHPPMGDDAKGCVQRCDRIYVKTLSS